MKPDFVHLHNHSEYSLLDGLIRFVDLKGGTSDFLKRLIQENTRAMALTDHGNLYGTIEFYTQCRQIGIKPVIGCELYVAKKSRTLREGPQSDNCHLTVLARTFEGYQNLMALSSRGFLEGFYYAPRIDRELLSKHAKGLTVLSGCFKSEISQAILAGDMPLAERLTADYRDMLEPGCFYLELMDHGLEEQKRIIKGLLEIHERTGLPFVATNDCHYARKEDYAAHEAFTCISTGKTLTDPTRLRFSQELYFKGAQEMAKLFHYAPESISNTVLVAESCNVEIPMGKSMLPHFPVPEGEDQDSYLQKLCWEGLKRLGLDQKEDYRERLTYELGVIRRMGFSGYFLIVWDFIHYAKNNGVPVGPGRGSGAGALVCYTLDITAVDPIQHKLLFERFLNPDRVSMPDLDIDFSDQGREQVISYVRGKYGHDNVAQIVTFGSLKARLAIRDVGRVLGIPLSDVDKLAKLVPLGKTIHEAQQMVPELAEAAKDKQLGQLLDLAHRVEGLKRHTGIHAAGIVITDGAVVKYAPVSKSPNSESVTTQYDGDYLPKLGLLKMDFLGLRNLTVIENAVRLIRGRARPDFDIWKIPFDDKKTYELLASGKALGVFQLDSEGMRELLRRLKPTTFEDISAVIALYRPGPMSSGMLDLFVERKHGAAKVRYDHPKMEPVLKDTYGCMVYQEQVMEISKTLAGYTPGEADVLRKAMGKKDPAEFERQREKFIGGCKKNNIADKLSTKIYDQIVKFGGYGFNKSHTVAYGTVAYQTAYLKANHPIEFVTALLTSEIGHSAVDVEGKENKLVTYLDDAKAMGIQVLPPDIQRSEAVFSIEGDSIRFGLTAVKNVGRGAAEILVAARKDRPFDSLDDLCGRLDLHTVNRKTIESLVKAGALDCLMPGLPIEEIRARLMHTLDETMGRQGRIKDDLARGQGQLFGGDIPVARPSDADSDGLEKIEPWHEHDLLQAEREVLGFYISGHPLVRYKDRLAVAATHRVEELASLPPEASGGKNGRNGRNEAKIRLAGIINQVKKIVTKKGDAMARAVLEDLTGEINVIVFPKVYAAVGGNIRTNSIVVVTGRLAFPASFKGDESDKPAPEIHAEEVMPLDLAISRYAGGLTLHFSTVGLEESLLEQLKDLLRSHPGSTPVFLRVNTPTGQTLIETHERVALEDPLFDELGKLLGEKSWQIQNAS